MVTTTSTTRRSSSVHLRGRAEAMSIPTSAIAATAPWLTSAAGSEPAESAVAPEPARRSNHPSAICERPALCTHRNSTVGLLKGPLVDADASSMSDLSRMLDDLYALPGTDTDTDSEVVTDEPLTRAPSWSSEEALDEAFASWVPGEADGTTAFERSMVADAPATLAEALHVDVGDWLSETEP